MQQRQVVEMLGLVAIAVLLAVGNQLFEKWGLEEGRNRSSGNVVATPYGKAAQILSKELLKTPMVIAIGAVGGRRLATELQLRNSRLHAIIVDDAKRIEKMTVDQHRRLTFIPANVFSDIPEGSNTYAVAEFLHECDENEAFELIAAVTRSAEMGHLEKDAVLYILENLRDASSDQGLPRRIPRVEAAYRSLLEKHGWTVEGDTREADPQLHIIRATRTAGLRTHTGPQEGRSQPAFTGSGQS